MAVGNDILRILGEVVLYGGVVTGLAFALFRFLGQKWIEGKFAEKLESYKHEQNKEIENLRFRINTIFSRVVKLHDKEFEILPIAWGLVNDAYQAVLRCISGFRQFPDLDKLSEQELEEFLTGTDFSDTQKNRIRASDQKVGEYGKIVTWVEIELARKAFFEFHSYIVKNRIFLGNELKEMYDRVDNIMLKMWVIRRIEEQWGKREKIFNEFQENNTAIEELLSDIEKRIHDRLQPVEPL